MPRAGEAVETASQYEQFADVYAVWTRTAGSTGANLPYYRDAYLAADGPVVELGIGDGRIAVEAARRGCRVTGVDASPAMLRLCRERAARAGVTDRLRLLEADFRSFQLAEPAALVALPYHSVGHLTTPDDRRRAFDRIHGQLRPGGRFLFDDFHVTGARVAELRRVELRAAYTRDGADRLLWVTSLVEEASRLLTVVTWEDTLDADGRLADRRYRQLHLSWMPPEEAAVLLRAAGFEVEACWGDFDGTPFDAATATEQIWAARRPA